MTRIRKLVDMAHEADPRIIKFRQQDKDAKLAQKAARQNAIQVNYIFKLEIRLLIF